MSFMSKKLKVKSALLAGVVVLSLIIMGVILSTMQDNISLENYRADIQREMDELPTLLETADDETAQNEETFDAIYQSKATIREQLRADRFNDDQKAQVRDVGNEAARK